MWTKKIVKKRKYGYRLHIYGILGTPTTSTGRRRNHSLERENHNGCIFWQQKNNSINTTLRIFNVTMWFFSMVFQHIIITDQYGFYFWNQILPSIPNTTTDSLAWDWEWRWNDFLRCISLYRFSTFEVYQVYINLTMIFITLMENIRM